MSMLSAQCDELREMAGQLQEHGTFVGFGGTTNTDPLMHGAAIVMREAADTIWDLRDMVHKERAEADRLRELVRDYHTFLALADLAQPIGHIIAASGHPTLSVESLDSRYRELGVDDG